MDEILISRLRSGLERRLGLTTLADSSAIQKSFDSASPVIRRMTRLALSVLGLVPPPLKLRTLRVSSSSPGESGIA